MNGDTARCLFVFDIDGTLLDTFTFFNEFTGVVFERFGVEPDSVLLEELREEVLRMLAGSRSKLLIVKVVLRATKMMGLSFFDRWRFLFHVRKVYEDNIDKVKFLPGAIDAIDAIRDAGHRVAILTTGSAKDFAIKFKGRMELLDHVETHVVRDDVKYTKPAPDGIHLIRERLAIGEETPVIMVGDMTHDIGAGLAAGGISIGVLTGVNTQEELEEAGAALVFESVSELPARLDQVVELARSKSP